jgi:hypothetical protein
MAEDAKEMQDPVAQLRHALQGLSRLTFPTLRRPQPAPNGAPTLELVNWAVRLYCYSLLSHFREMLRSFLFLGDNGHVPAGFVVCRCLFEVGAHAYYVHKHVTQFLGAADLQNAWDFLNEINMGSRYMREEYGEEEDWPEFVEPREIGKVIRCFDEWTGHTGQAVAEYSFLSEFAHPNMAAFSHYYNLGRTPTGDINAKFSRNFPEEPLTHISYALEATLRFSSELLVAAGESAIVPRLEEILAEYNTSNLGGTDPLP